jgi:hypothetical protein
MICPDCHHSLSCRFDGEGRQCHCECHDLAEAAPELLHMLAEITGEAIGGTVMDVTARKAMALMNRLNKPVTDKLLLKVKK